MNELMSYLGWFLCGCITGAVVGVGSIVLFAVWFSKRKKEQEEVQKYQDGVQDPPYYQPN